MSCVFIGLLLIHSIACICLFCIGVCQAGHVCGDNMDVINGQPTGSVRISFGYMSTVRDVEEIVKFVIGCFVDDVDMSDKEELCYTTVKIAMDNVFTTDIENLQTEIHPLKESIDTGNSQSITNENLDETQAVMIPESNTKEKLHESVNLTVMPREKDEERKVTLCRIFLYPVKSCGALEVSHYSQQILTLSEY